ncbi:MAG: hypothetical protein RR749_00765 [Comamonas sp.]
MQSWTTTALPVAGTFSDPLQNSCPGLNAVSGDPPISRGEGFAELP